MAFLSQAILVFLGGGLGCILRFSFGFVFQKTSLQLPIATLFSNITACMLFAFTLYYIESKPIATAGLRLFMLTGFCGGLSTFSTFGYETYMLLKQSQYFWVVLNIVISLVLCIGSFALIKAK